MASPLLTLEHAGFHYHASRWIFRNVNVQVSSGEVFVILGRNGVGKSTLLNSIIGLLSLTEGKVILGDQDLRKLSAGERARHVAYLPQIEGSGISYTVAEYLLMGRAPYIGLFSSPSADDRARVMNVLQELGTDATVLRIDYDNTSYNLLFRVIFRRCHACAQRMCGDNLRYTGRR